MPQNVFEIEIKLRLLSAEVPELVDRCRTLASSNGEQTTQVDEYFDTTNADLNAADLTLRVRSTSGMTQIAMKGPRLHGQSGVYRRVELEFAAASEEEVRRQIERQSLVATAIIEKRRTKFQMEKAAVFIDEVPFIGAFVEVESSSDDLILGTLKMLDITEARAEVKNYTELLEATMHAIGLPIRPQLRATFEAERSWRDRSTFGRATRRP